MTAQRESRDFLASLVILNVAGVTAGALLAELRAPLPWMIGPIVTTSMFTLWRGFRTPPVAVRWGGQWIVASAVAMNLSPAALRVIASDVVLMVAVALASIGFAVVAASWLNRLGLVDRRTGVLALLPGGAAEMAELASAGGGRADLVVLAQTVRLTLTIFVVPLALVALGPDVVGAASFVLPSQSWQAVVALLIALPVSVWVHRRGVSNAFFIAPLAVVGILALTGLATGGLPAALIAGGQVMLGVSLGAMLPVRHLVRQRRALRLAGAFALSLVGLGIVFAAALAAIGIAPLGQLMLATSAGGVAEMAVAAKTLGFDPAYVTAYHLVRIFLIVTLAAPILRLLER